MLWHQQRSIESGDSQATVEQEATVIELEAILQNELNGTRILARQEWAEKGKNLLDISFRLKNDVDNSV